jgi:hypothetical protein
MATTDSRTGFRLPWSTDRSASREATAEPADEPAASTLDQSHDTSAAPAPNPSDNSQDAAEIAVRGQEDEPVTTLATGSATGSAWAGPAATGNATPESASESHTVTGLPDQEQPPGEPSTGARRPTRFLADLTRAMQAAAEQARAATLEQFRADGTAVIEQIHARFADGATELRRHADDDTAAIKDWSKAEIARIREETERRIGSRREQLEGQLERHAALIEHEIEKVRGRIAAFELEMGSFFDSLVGEDDPAVFAARAASLPEPPSFADPDDDALSALLREPGFGVPMAAAEAVADATDEVSGAGEQRAEASDAATPTPGDEGPVLDREAAMAAIQAAAEAAGSVEDGEGHEDRADATADGPAAAGTPDDSTAPDQTDVTGDTPVSEAAVEAGDTPGETVDAEAQVEEPGELKEAAAAPEYEVDPRLAMLGLTPDFAAAELEAAEAAAATEDVPEIGSDALAARLSGLVATASAEEQPAQTTTTQVIVTGLVSVASIASFKRHLGRLAGVAHVGVSSGPDGEFVFAVAHDPAISLRESIPTIPAFGARVVGSDDGIVQVSAQDPQD